MRAKKTEGFKIEWIETAKLKPAVYNPRKDLQPGDPEYIQIQKSLNEFGLVDPLVVNSDMTVISGHQRLKILIEAGFDKVPCSIVTLNKTQEKKLNVALNRPYGKWDVPILRDILLEFDDGLFDVGIIGFEEIEIEEIMGKAPQIGPKKPKKITCPECGHEFTLGREKE
jgi:site-specific DNA-methyltransferase (adenine-specific)